MAKVGKVTFQLFQTLEKLGKLLFNFVSILKPSKSPFLQISPPARPGPGSHGVVPETASGWVLGRPLEATTVSEWLEMFLRWFLERFGSQHAPDLGSSWAHLGTPQGPKMQYVLRFLMFLRIRLYLFKLPKMLPRGSLKGFKRPREDPKRGPG